MSRLKNISIIFFLFFTASVLYHLLYIVITLIFSSLSFLPLFGDLVSVFVSLGYISPPDIAASLIAASLTYVAVSSISAHFSKNENDIRINYAGGILFAFTIYDIAVYFTSDFSIHSSLVELVIRLALSGSFLLKGGIKKGSCILAIFLCFVFLCLRFASENVVIKTNDMIDMTSSDVIETNQHDRSFVICTIQNSSSEDFERVHIYTQDGDLSAFLDGLGTEEQKKVGLSRGDYTILYYTYDGERSTYSFSVNDSSDGVFIALR